MLTGMLGHLRDFGRDQRGTVAIIFGLAFFVVILSAGIAIDVGRVMHVNSKISSALDAAALAAAKARRESGLTDTETEEVAHRFFLANMRGHGGDYATVTSFRAVVDSRSNSIQLHVEADAPTIFGNIAGVGKFSFPKSATAIYKQDLELAMALDITGSMCSPCTKIDALKAAAKDLVDILLPDGDTGDLHRIAIAPYAATVNVSSYNRAVANGRSADGCVIERLTGDRESDAAPGTGGYFAVHGDLNSGSNGRYSCPTSEVMPLSNDKRALKSHIDGLRTGGFTAGHLGAQWAWHMLAPAWESVWPSSSKPAAYNDGKTIKAMILMTDGEFNTSYTAGTSSSAQTNQSFLHARNICANMKADQKIIVYTVGFQLRDRDAIDALRNCANTVEKHHFLAEDADELREAFRAIATQLANLRISS